MFQSLVRAILIRSGLVFVLLHAGLISAVVGLARLPADPATESARLCLGIGLACLYASLLLGAAFVTWPLVSLALRIRQILRWKEWILKELPAILALIPTVVATAKAAWTQGVAAVRPAAHAPPEPAPTDDKAA